MSIIREIYIGGATAHGRAPDVAPPYETLTTFKEPVLQGSASSLQEGQARPGLAIYPELSNQMQIAIGSVLTGESTPEQAARQRRRAGRPRGLRPPGGQTEMGDDQGGARPVPSAPAARSRAARAADPPAVPWLAPLSRSRRCSTCGRRSRRSGLSFTNTSLLREGSSYTLETPTARRSATRRSARSSGSPWSSSARRSSASSSLGLFIALVVQRAVRRKLRGAVLVRSIVLCAWVMPGILIGVIWQIVLNEAPSGW